MTRALVVGAGLSGLSAAWWLAERGFDVEVVDAGRRPGGLIQTRQSAHGLVETAAHAFVWTETTEAWFARLGIQPLWPRPAARRRYIYRDGRPRRWPLTGPETIATAGRLAAAVARRRTHVRGSESVADWGRRVLGPAAARWLVGAALQGIYAAPPEVLSARAVFGGRRRGRVRLAAPPGGMGEFVRRLFMALDRRGVRFQFTRRVEALSPGVPTVIATGAPSAAALVAPHAPGLGAALAAVKMLSVLTVTAFFEHHPHDLRGFGVLFPPGTGISARGVLFNDQIFEGRSDVRSETWIYDGVGSAGVAAQDAHEVRLRHGRTRLTGHDAPPLLVDGTTWAEALPLYDAAVLSVRASLAERPSWLALAGNYLGRLGVASLLDVAETAARDVHAG